MICVERSGRLLRFDDPAVLIWALEDGGFFEVFGAGVLRFAGLGDVAFGRESKEGPRADPGALENISVYRLCTWLGDRKSSSSESWISSTSMKEDSEERSLFDGFCELFFGVVASSGRVVAPEAADLEVRCFDLAVCFGLGLAV